MYSGEAGLLCHQEKSIKVRQDILHQSLANGLSRRVHLLSNVPLAPHQSLQDVGTATSAALGDDGSRQTGHDASLGHESVSNNASLPTNNPQGEEHECGTHVRRKFIDYLERFVLT
jgi:hypothetical protein